MSKPVIYRKIPIVFISSLERYFKDGYYRQAPALAYYFLLSIAPITLSLSYVAGFLFAGSSTVAIIINEYLPEQLSAILLATIESNSPTSGLISSILFFGVAVILASRGTFALTGIADRIDSPSSASKEEIISISQFKPNGDGDKAQKNALKDFSIKDAFKRLKVSKLPSILFSKLISLIIALIQRYIKSILLTLLLVIGLNIILLLIVYGGLLINIAISYIESDTVSEMIYWVYNLASFLIAPVVLFYILTLFYSHMPSKKIAFKKAYPGSLVAFIGLFLASWGFSIYLNYFYKSNVIYGALSSIVLLILWFYLISHVLIFAIIFNHGLLIYKEEKTD